METLLDQALQGNPVIEGNRATFVWSGDQPPTAEPCPLLVVLDGQDYRRRARITRIVDNLIAQGIIRPIALAMPYHGRAARGVEYACSEATLGFLLHDLLQLASTELNLVDIEAQPGAYGILGASMGGLSGCWTPTSLMKTAGAGNASAICPKMHRGR